MALSAAASRGLISLRAALICIGILFLFGSCSRGDDAKAIRKLIHKGAALAEKRDIPAVFALTTADFTAQPGGLNRHEARGALRWAFRYYGRFKLLFPRPKVEMEKDDNYAEAIVPFLIVKTEHSFAPLEELYQDPELWFENAREMADLYRFRFKMVRVDRRWLVREASLEKFTGLSFE
jgi:hypothetical protein